MTELNLTFRLGSAKGRTPGGGAADPREAAAKAIGLIGKAAQARGAERVVEAIVANRERIVAEVSADAASFAASAARVLTRIRAPSGGLTPGAGLSDRLRSRTTAEWRARTQETLAEKRRARQQPSGAGAGEGPSFAVESGELRRLLLDYLGPAVARLLAPTITVRRGAGKVTATLSVLAEVSGHEESLFLRALRRAGAGDPGTGLSGSRPPFLQNTLVFWLGTRLPVVLEHSLRAALATRLKKGK